MSKLEGPRADLLRRLLSDDARAVRDVVARARTLLSGANLDDSLRALSIPVRVIPLRGVVRMARPSPGPASSIDEALASLEAEASDLTADACLEDEDQQYGEGTFPGEDTKPQSEDEITAALALSGFVPQKQSKTSQWFETWRRIKPSKAPPPFDPDRLKQRTRTVDCHLFPSEPTAVEMEEPRTKVGAHPAFPPEPTKPIDAQHLRRAMQTSRREPFPEEPTRPVDEVELAEARVECAAGESQATRKRRKSLFDFFKKADGA